MLDKLESELQSSGELRNGRKRHRPSTAEEADIISALFQGELQSEVHCLRCGYRSETVERFTDLSLEFPAKDCRILKFSTLVTFLRAFSLNF